MLFEYSAQNRAGETVAGQIEAASAADARQQLRGQSLFVQRIARQGNGGFAFKQGTSRSWSRVSKSDLVLMMSQLSIMCQSGIDLAEALHNQAEQCQKPALRKVLTQIDQDVRGGSSLTEALKKHPEVFDDLFLASIAAGEQSGTMTQVLDRLTSLLRDEMRLRSTIWSMLMYPIVLGAVTFVVLNALVFFVLPQFATVFETLDRPVPPITQFMLGIGSFVRGHWMLLLGGAFAAGVASYSLRKAEAVLSAWDYLTLNLACLKKVTRALLTGRTFRLLGTMLMTGVPLLEGIRLCRSATKNRFFRKLFEDVERDVLNGEGLAGPLKAAEFLPAGAAQMVVTAERSGKMGEVLKHVGEYYEDEGERCLRDLVKIAEPAVIVVLGVIVAGVVLSIIIPMLDVSSTSQV